MSNQADIDKIVQKYCTDQNFKHAVDEYLATNEPISTRWEDNMRPHPGPTSEKMRQWERDVNKASHAVSNLDIQLQDVLHKQVSLQSKDEVFGPRIQSGEVRINYNDIYKAAHSACRQ